MDAAASSTTLLAEAVLLGKAAPITPKDEAMLLGKAAPITPKDEAALATANVGVPTGLQTFDVLDVDPRHGGDASLISLMNGNALPDGPSALTGGGGRHFLFSHVHGLGTRSGFRPGLDWKSTGGYVVVAPSLHPSGKRYRWEKERTLGKVVIPAAPNWLVETLTQRQQRQRKREGPLHEGKRNDQLFRSACAMRREGLGRSEIVSALEQVNQSRCKPPLDHDELLEIAESATRYKPFPSAVTATEDLSFDIKVDDFRAYMPMHNYIHVPSLECWPGVSVDSQIPLMVTGKDENGKDIVVKATAFLDKHRHVEQMTWCPGLPAIIEDRLVSNGGWIEQKGCNTFNLYQPPSIALGDPERAGRWLDHIKRLYPDHHGHIIRWLAYRVQRPDVKINHALVLGGAQGIGKDTILDPIAHAVGPWNFQEVSPAQMIGRFNAFLKSVILRVSEARNLGEVNRFNFYEHMKPYIASPPEILRCDEKFLREYTIFNLCGVVMTTNHQSNGIYLPADDRRHFVVWSDRIKDDFAQNYWTEIYTWYQRDGRAHVAAYLHQLDLSDFDPKAPPPKTPAFWVVVHASRAPEDSELADAIDALGDPDAVTIDEIATSAAADFAEWLRDRRNARQVPHRLEAVGYVSVPNDRTTDGRWKVRGKNRMIYARQDLPFRDQVAAAARLCREYSP